MAAMPVLKSSKKGSKLLRWNKLLHRLDVWFSGRALDAPAFISGVFGCISLTNLPGAKKMAPVKGAIFPLVPTMVPPDDYVTVTIAMIPSAMPATVMSIEPNARTVIVAVAIVVSVAADPYTKSLSACDCRGRNSDGC